MIYFLILSPLRHFAISPVFLSVNHQYDEQDMNDFMIFRADVGIAII